MQRRTNKDQSSKEAVSRISWRRTQKTGWTELGLEEFDDFEVQKKDDSPGRNHSKNNGVNTHNLYMEQ